MSEEPGDKGTDFSEYARKRPGAPPPLPRSQPSDTERFIRGFFRILLRVIAIAVGLAFLLIMLILGVCFIR